MVDRTTGTTSFNLDLNNLVEDAFERCGQELRTGYDLRTARRSLNLLTIEKATSAEPVIASDMAMLKLLFVVVPQVPDCSPVPISSIFKSL